MAGVNGALRLLAAALLAAPLAASATRVDVQLLDAGGGALEGAVVFLESPAARAAVTPAVGVEIEQMAKRFTQRLTVVPVGSEISFPNRDKVRHHVFSFSPTKTFELKLYAGTPANPVLFDRPGVAVLGCNIHDTMLAWVLVVETPYYAQSNALGQLRLPEVPPGSYRLRTWHPGMAPGAAALEQPLLVGATPQTALVRTMLAPAAAR
jgi:plastocyanin